MKLLTLRLLVFGSLLASTLNAALDFKNDFNLPSEESFTYPPAPGTPFEGLDCGISGWGDTGLIRITHGGGYGTKNTGGIFLEIVEPTTRYLSANFSKLTLRNVTPETLSRDLLATLKFSADLKMPAGRSVEIHLHPTLPSDMRARAWPSRLILGRFTGTGEFTTITVNGASLPADVQDRFLGALRDAALNGQTSAVFDLTFYFGSRDGWEAGDAAHLDNVSLQIGR